MVPLPPILTHNYHPDRGAFRNICDLPRVKAERILRDIADKAGRPFKPSYLRRRLATELWLIAERKRKLGPTYLARPIYVFLGDFAGGRDPTRPLSIQLPLAAFAPDTITFTYPDSMASLPIALEDVHAPHRKPYHGQVFTLDEICQVVADYGLPGERWRSDPTRLYDRFIEAQVWDDGPIRQFAKASQAYRDSRSALRGSDTRRSR